MTNERTTASADRKVVVIVNPTKFDDLEQAGRQVREAAAAVGWPAPRLVETTEDDPGYGQTRQALDEGADLVCALGGDGTVRAVAQVLAGTGVPMGLLPGGTGNLLARNLGAPVTDLAEAVQVALTGTDRAIDLGWLALDPTAEQQSSPLTPAPGEDPADNVHAFAVMAGVGFDAQIMDDAPEGLKAKVGWAAYVVAAARNLRGDGFEAAVGVDGAAQPGLEARTVVVGNCGTLQGGIELLPDAVVDDGLLDVVVLTPAGLAGWAGVAANVVTGQSPAHSDNVERMQGRDVTLTLDPPQKVEVDGDVLDEAGRLRMVVQPGALVVRVAQAPPD